MVHVPRARRLKWDKKSQQMTLVGYSETTKGYRVYNKTNDSVITSRDVIIIENSQDSVDTLSETEVHSGTNSVGAEIDVFNDGSENCEIMANERIVTNDTALHEDVVSETTEGDDRTPENREVQVEAVRRSARAPKPKTFDECVTLCTDNAKLDNEPLTASEALSRPDGELWQQAMIDELQSFEENQAWELVDKQTSGTIVKCKWVFKRKFEVDNPVKV